jgi:ABC-2 type transport system ATP-binding protein
MNSILLSTDNVSKVRLSHKQKKTVLDNINLHIKRGEIIALLGANGAGKTTLSSLIASIYPPTTGDVLFEGRSIYHDICAYRKAIGYCPQKINLDNDLTVEHNLQCAGRYMGLSEPVIQERVERSIVLYGLHKYRTNKPDTLSGGYARRVLLARALIHNPQLLILDEPTVGLDPHIRHQLWDIIRDLRAQGVTIILTTHYLDEAEYLADRVCVLERGKVRLIDTPAGLKATYHKSSLEDVFVQLLKEEAQS